MERINRWHYNSGKPNRFARVLNAISAWIYKLRFTPDLVDTLEITGRVSGKPVQMPIVVVHLDGAEYIVSMLGAHTNWVKNLRAADGHAALLKGGRRSIRLLDVPVAERAPILKRYCEIAPAGRVHIPVEPSAAFADFANIANEYPVFRIEIDEN